MSLRALPAEVGRVSEKGEGEGGGEEVLDSASGQTKRTRVNYTFGYLCINTLAVGGTAKGSAEVKKEVRQGRRDEGQQQWANCCFASGLKFNWLV